MPRDLVILGAGGMGQEVADLVAAVDGDAWNLIGFLDDDLSLAGQEVVGISVLGRLDWLADRSVSVALAVGSPARRRQAVQLLGPMAGVPAPALVHPSAYVGKTCRLGPGTLVGAGATITVDVRVGAFGIVNIGATVSHNARLDDFATLAPGAHLAGNVHVGEGADIGIGSSIVPGRSVGEWSVVGAGAVVIDDVEPNTTVVGCPARVIDTRPPGWQG